MSKNDTKITAFGCLLTVVVAVNLVFAGVILWAIIRLVQAYT